MGKACRKRNSKLEGWGTIREEGGWEVRRGLSRDTLATVRTSLIGAPAMVGGEEGCGEDQRAWDSRDHQARNQTPGKPT